MKTRMTKSGYAGAAILAVYAFAFFSAEGEDLYFCPNADGGGLTNWKDSSSNHGWYINKPNWTNSQGVAKAPTSSDVIWFNRTPTNAVNGRGVSTNAKYASGGGSSDVVNGVIYTNGMSTTINQGSSVTLAAGGVGVKIDSADVQWNTALTLNGTGEVPVYVPSGSSLSIQKDLKSSNSRGVLVKRGGGRLAIASDGTRDFTIAGIRMEGGPFTVGNASKSSSLKLNETTGFTLTFANNDPTEVFTLAYGNLGIKNLTIVETEDVNNTEHGFTSSSGRNLAYLGGTSTVNPMSFTGSFNGSAGLVWAPANSDTEIVLKRAAHTTTGGIWVSNGVVRVSERTSFLSISKVVVHGSGATFAVDSSAVQAFPSAAFEISSGGKIRSEAGAIVIVGSLSVDGVSVDAGMYDTAEWKSGEGRVVVLPLAAATGAWTSSEGPLALGSGVTRYTAMTFDAATDTTLTAADGALVTLGEGGLSTLTGSKTVALGWPIAIDGAQEWKIAGGDTVEQTGAISTFADGRVLVDAGGATVNMRGANTFANELVLSNGSFHVWNDHAFGSAAGKTKMDLNVDTTVTFHGVTIDDRIEVERMKNSTKRLVFAANTTNVFNGPLTVGRQSDSVEGNFFPEIEAGARLICRGGVTKDVGIIGPGGDGEMVVTNKILTTRRLQSDGNGTLVLAVANNSLGENAASVKNMKTTVPYAVNSDSFRIAIGGTWDMCGTDQKIGVFAKACTGVVESDSPAWLHMVDNQDSKTSDGGVTSRVTRVRFQGAASWSKEGSRTNWVMNTSSTTGVLAIANGRLVMSSGSGSAVTIDEKSSARYPRSLGSWPNASLVSVSGGTLVIEHGASFGKQTALELSGEGQVELSAGARQDFATLTIDGEPQPAGIYGGPESGAQIMPKKGDGTYWFSGSGRVRVGGAMDGVMLIVF